MIEARTGCRQRDTGRLRAVSAEAEVRAVDQRPVRAQERGVVCIKVGRQRIALQQMLVPL